MSLLIFRYADFRRCRCHASAMLSPLRLICCAACYDTLFDADYAAAALLIRAPCRRRFSLQRCFSPALYAIMLLRGH